MRRRRQKLTTKNRLILAVVAILAVSILSTGLYFGIAGNRTVDDPSTDLNGSVTGDIESIMSEATASAKTSSDGVVTPSNKAGEVISSHTIPSGATAISTATELKNFIEGSATYGYLTADLTVGSSSTSRTNVSSGTLSNTQTLDGNGHTITFLSSDGWGMMTYNTTSTPSGMSGTTYLQGFLMAINNGTICNLNIVIDGIYKANNGSNSSYNIVVGAFAASNAGTIENCSTYLTERTTMNIHSQSASSSNATVYNGLIAGVNSGTIEYCSTTCNVADTQVSTAGTAAFGGITAHNSGTVANCTFDGHGKITGNANSSSAAIGGIVGSNNSGTISMCHNGFTGTYNITTTGKSVGLIAGTYVGSAAKGWTASHSSTLSTGTNTKLTTSNTTYSWTSVTNMIGGGTNYNIGMSGGAVKFGEITDSYVYYDYWGQSEKLYIGFYDAAALSDIAEVNMDHDTTNQLLSKKFTDTSTFYTGSDSSYLGASGITYQNSYEYNLGYGSVAATHRLGQTTMVTTGTRVTSSTTFPLTGSTDYYLTEDVYIDLYTNYNKAADSFYNGQFYGNGYSIYFYTSSNYGITDLTLTTVGSGSYAGIITSFMGTGGGVSAEIHDVSFVFLPNTNFSATSAASNAYFGILTGGFQTNDDNKVNNVKIDIQDGANITFGGTSGNSYFGIVMGGIYGGGTAGSLENIWVNLDGTINVAQNPSNSIFAGGVFGYMQGSNSINKNNGRYILSGSGKFRSTTTVGHTWTNVGIFGGVVGGSNYTLNTTTQPLEILLWDWAWSMNKDDNGTSKGGVIKFVGGMNNVSAYDARKWCNQVNVYSINVSYTNANGAYTASGPVAQGVGSDDGTLTGSTLSTYSGYSIYQALGTEVAVADSQKAPGSNSSMSAYQATAYVDFAIEFSTIANGYSNRSTYKTSYQPNTGYGYASDGKTVQQLAVLTPKDIKTDWIKAWTGSRQSVSFDNITVTSLAPLSLLKEYYGGTAAEAVDAYYTAVNNSNVPEVLATKMSRLNTIAALSGIGYTLSNASGTNVGSYAPTASITSSYNNAMAEDSFARLYILPQQLTISSVHAIYKTGADNNIFSSSSTNRSDFHNASTGVNASTGANAITNPTSLNISGLTFKFSDGNANAQWDNVTGTGANSTSGGTAAAKTVSVLTSGMTLLGTTYRVLGGGYYVSASSVSGDYASLGSIGYIHSLWQSSSGAAHTVKIYQNAATYAPGNYLGNLVETSVQHGGTYNTVYRDGVLLTTIVPGDFTLTSYTDTTGTVINNATDLATIKAGVANAGTYSLNKTGGSSMPEGYYNSGNTYSPAVTAGNADFTLVVNKYILRAFSRNDNGYGTTVYGEYFESDVNSGALSNDVLVYLVEEAPELAKNNPNVTYTNNIASSDYSTVSRALKAGTYSFTITLTDAFYKNNSFASNSKTASGGTLTVAPKSILPRRQVKNVYYKQNLSATNPLTYAEFSKWVGVSGIVPGDDVSSGVALKRVSGGLETAITVDANTVLTERGFYKVSASEPVGTDMDNYTVEGDSTSFTVYLSDGMMTTEIAWAGSSSTNNVGDGYITDAGNVIVGYTITAGFPIANLDNLVTFINGNYSYGYLTNNINVSTNISAGTLVSGRTLDGNGYTITYQHDNSDWDEIAKRSTTNHMQGILSGSTSYVYAGGLLAYNAGTIKNLKFVYKGTNYYNTESETSSHHIQGLLVGGNAGTIENCSVTIAPGGNARLHPQGLASNAGLYFGGIAGFNTGKILYTTFTHNGNHFDIGSNNSNSTSHAFIGGIAAVNTGGGTIKYCISNGSGRIANHAKHSSDGQPATNDSAIGGIVGFGESAATTNNTRGYVTITPGVVKMVYSGFVGAYNITNGIKPIGKIAGIYYGDVTQWAQSYNNEELGWFVLASSAIEVGYGANTHGAYTNGDYTAEDVNTIIGCNSLDNTVNKQQRNRVAGGRVWFSKKADHNIYFDYWSRSDRMYIELGNDTNTTSITAAGGLSVLSGTNIAYISEATLEDSVVSWRHADNDYYGLSAISYSSSSYETKLGYGSVAPAGGDFNASDDNILITGSTVFPLSGSDTYYLMDDVYIDLRDCYNAGATTATFSGTLEGNGHTIYFTTGGEGISKERTIGGEDMGLITDYMSGGTIQNITFAFVDCVFEMNANNPTSGTKTEVAGLIVGKMNNSPNANTFYNVKVDIQDSSNILITTDKTDGNFKVGILFGRIANQNNSSKIGNVWINHQGTLRIDGCSVIRFAPLYGYADNDSSLNYNDSTYYVLSGEGTIKAEAATGASNKDNAHFFGTFSGFSDDNRTVNRGTGGNSYTFKVIYWDWGWYYENNDFQRGGGARDGWQFASALTAYFINCTDEDRGSGTKSGDFSIRSYHTTTISDSDVAVIGNFHGLTIDQVIGKGGRGDDYNGVYSSIATTYTSVTGGFTADQIWDKARYANIGYVVEDGSIKMKSAIINADDARPAYQYTTNLKVISSDFLNVSMAWVEALVNTYGGTQAEAYSKYLDGLASTDTAVFSVANDLYKYAQSLSFGMDLVFPVNNVPRVTYTGSISVGDVHTIRHNANNRDVTLNPRYNVGDITCLAQFFVLPAIYNGTEAEDVMEYNGTSGFSVTINDGGTNKNITFTYRDGAGDAVKDANAQAFRLLESQPSDWATAYNTKYYALDNSTHRYHVLTGSTAPTFVQNTYYEFFGLMDGEDVYSLTIPVYHYTQTINSKPYRYYDEEGNYFDQFSYYAFDFAASGGTNSAYPTIVAARCEDLGNQANYVISDTAYIAQRGLTAVVNTKTGANTRLYKYYDSEDGIAFKTIYNHTDNDGIIYDDVAFTGANVSGETVSLNITADNIRFVTSPYSTEILDPYQVGKYEVYLDLSSEFLQVSGGQARALNYAINNITYESKLVYDILAIAVYVPTIEVGTDSREYTAGKQHFAAPVESGVKIVEKYLARNGNDFTGILEDQWDKYGAPIISKARVLSELIDEACGGDGGQGLAVAYVYLGAGDAKGYTFVNYSWTDEDVRNNYDNSYEAFAHLDSTANAGFGAISTDGAINVGEYIYYGYTTATNFYAPTDIYENVHNAAGYAGISFATIYTNGKSNTPFAAGSSQWAELAELTGDYRLAQDYSAAEKEGFLAQSLQMLATDTGLGNYNLYSNLISNKVYVTVADVSIYAEDQSIEYGQDLQNQDLLDNKAYIISQLPDNMSMDEFKDTLDENGFRFAVSRDYIQQNGEIRNPNNGADSELWILLVKLDDFGSVMAWRNAIEPIEYVDFNLDLTIISGNLTVYHREIRVEWAYDTDGYDAERNAYVFDPSNPSKEYSISRVLDVYGVISGDNKPSYEVKNIVTATNVGVYSGVYLEFNTNQAGDHYKNYYFGDGATGSFEIVPANVPISNVQIYVGSSNTSVNTKIPEVSYGDQSFKLSFTSNDSNYRAAVIAAVNNVQDGPIWLKIGNEGEDNVITIDTWAATQSGNTVTLTASDIDLSGLESTKTALAVGISRFTSGNYTFYNDDGGNNTSGSKDTSNVYWMYKDVTDDGGSPYTQVKSTTYNGSSRSTASYSNTDWVTNGSYNGVIDLSINGATTYNFTSTAQYYALGEALKLSDYTNDKNGVRKFVTSDYTGMEFYYKKDGRHDYGLTNALVWMDLTSSDPETAEGLRSGKYYFDVDGIFATRSEFSISSWWFTPAYISTTVYGIEDPYAKDYVDCVNVNNSYQLAKTTPNTYGWESNDKDLYSSTAGWVEFNWYGQNTKGEIATSEGLSGYTAYRVVFMLSMTNHSGTMDYGLIDAKLGNLSVAIKERSGGAVESVTDDVDIDYSQYGGDVLCESSHRLEDGNIEFVLTSTANSLGLQYGIDLAKISMTFNQNYDRSGDSRTLDIANGGLVVTDTTYKRTATGKMILSSVKLKTCFELFGRHTKPDDNTKSTIADYACSGYYYDKLTYVSDKTFDRHAGSPYYIDTEAPYIYITNVDNTDYEDTADGQQAANGAIYGGWTVEGTKHITIRAKEAFVAATGVDGNPANAKPQSGMASGLAKFEYSTSAGFENAKLAAIEGDEAIFSIVIDYATHYYFRATDAAGNQVTKVVYYNTNDRESDLNLTIIGSPNEYEDDQQAELDNIETNGTLEDLHNFINDNNLTSYTENTWTNKNVLMRLAGYGEGNSLARVYYRRIYSSRDVDRTIADTMAASAADNTDQTLATELDGGRKLKLWLYGYDINTPAGTDRATMDLQYKLDPTSNAYKYGKITTDINLASDEIMKKIFLDVERLISANATFNTYPTLGSVDFTMNGRRYVFDDNLASHIGSQGMVRWTEGDGQEVTVNLNTQTITILDGLDTMTYYYGASAVGYELAEGRVLYGDGNVTITLQPGYWMGTDGLTHNGVTLVNRIQNSNGIVLSSLERTIVTGSFLAYNNGTIRDINFVLNDDMYIRATQNTVFGLIAGINNGTISNTSLKLTAGATYNVHTFGLEFNNTILVGMMSAVNHGYITKSPITIDAGAEVMIRPNIDIPSAVGSGYWGVVNAEGEADFVYGSYAAVNSEGAIEDNVLTINSTVSDVYSNGQLVDKRGGVTMMAVDENTSTIAVDDNANYAYAGLLVGVMNTSVANCDLIRELNIVVKGNTYTTLPVSGNTVQGSGAYYVTIEDNTVYNTLSPDRIVIDQGSFAGTGIAVAYTASDINYGWIALEIEEYGKLLVLSHEDNWDFVDNGIYSLEIKITSGTGVSSYIIAESGGKYYYNTGAINPEGITPEAVEIEDNQISSHDSVSIYTGQATTINSNGSAARYTFSDDDYLDVSLGYDTNSADGTSGLYYIVELHSAKTNGATDVSTFHVYPEKYEGKTYVELRSAGAAAGVVGTVKGSDYDVTEAYINGRGFALDWTGWVENGVAYAELGDTIISSLAGAEFKSETEVGRFNIKIDDRTYNIAFRTYVDIVDENGIASGYQRVDGDINQYIHYYINNEEFDNSNIEGNNNTTDTFFVLWDNGTPAGTLSDSVWVVEGGQLLNYYIENEVDTPHVAVGYSINWTDMTVTYDNKTGYLLKSKQVPTSTENDPTSWATIDLLTVMTDGGATWYGIETIDTHMLGDQATKLTNFNGTEWVMTEEGKSVQVDPMGDAVDTALQWKRTAAINVQDDGLESGIIRDVNLIVTVRIKYYASYNVSVKDKDSIVSEYGTASGLTYMYYKNPNNESDNDVIFDKDKGTNLDNMWAEEAEFYAVDLTADGLYYNTSSYQTYTMEGDSTYKTDKLLVAKGVRNITDFYEIDIYDIAEELQVNTLTPAGDHHIVLKSATLGESARNYILNFKVADYYTVTKANINVDIEDNFGKLYDGTALWTEDLNMTLVGGALTDLHLADYEVDQVGFYYKGDAKPTLADAKKLNSMDTGRYLTIVIDNIAVDAPVTSYAVLNAAEAPKDWATATGKYYIKSGNTFVSQDGATFTAGAGYYIKQKAGKVIEIAEDASSVVSFTAHGYTFTVDGTNVISNNTVRGTINGTAATVYTEQVHIDYGYFMVASGDHDVATPNVGGNLKLFLQPNSSYQFDSTISTDDYIVSTDLPVYTGATLVVADKEKTGKATYNEAKTELLSVTITYRHNDNVLTAVKQADGSYDLMYGDSRRAVYSGGIIEFIHMDNPLYGQQYYLTFAEEDIYKDTEGWSSVQLSNEYAKLYRRGIYVQGRAIDSSTDRTVSVVFNGAAQASSAATGVEEVRDYDVLLAGVGDNLAINALQGLTSTSLIGKGWYGTLVGENPMFNASLSQANADKPILAGTYQIEYKPGAMTSENVTVSTIESTSAAINTNSISNNYYIAGVLQQGSDSVIYKTLFNITESENAISVNRVVSDDGDRYVILVTVTGLAQSYDGLSFINATNAFTVNGSDSFLEAIKRLNDNDGYYDFSVETEENKALIAERNLLLSKDVNSERAAAIKTQIETSVEYLWQKAVGEVFRVSVNGGSGFSIVNPSISSDTFGNFHMDTRTGKLTFEYYGNRNLDAIYVSDRYSIKIAGKTEALSSTPGNLDTDTLVNSSNIDTTKSALSDGQITLDQYVTENTTGVDNTYTFISTADELLAWLKMDDSNAAGYHNGVLTTNIIGFSWGMVGNKGGAQNGLEAGRTLDGNGYAVELAGDQISALETYSMHFADWENLGDGYAAIETHGTAVMVGGMFVQYIAATAQIKNVNFVYTSNIYYIHDESIGAKNIAIGIVAGVALTDGTNPALSNVTLEIRGRFGYKKTGGMSDSMVLAFGGMVGIAAGKTAASNPVVMEKCSIFYYKTSRAVIPDMGDYDLYLHVDEEQGEHIMYGGFIGELNKATVKDVSVRVETNSAGEKSKLYAGVTDAGGWLFIGGGIGASRNAYAGAINGYINKFDTTIMVVNNMGSGQTYVGSIGGNLAGNTNTSLSNIYSYISSYSGVTAVKQDGSSVSGTVSINKMVGNPTNPNSVPLVNSLPLEIYDDDPGMVDYYFGSNNYASNIVSNADGKATIENYTSTVFINDATLMYNPYSTGWTAGSKIYSSYLRTAEYEVGTINGTLSQASGSFTINDVAYSYQNATGDTTKWTFTKQDGDTSTQFTIDGTKFTIKNLSTGSTFYYGTPAETSAILTANEGRINIEVLAPLGYFIWDYHEANYTNTLTDQGAVTRLVWNIPTGSEFGNNDANTAGTETTYYKHADSVTGETAESAATSGNYWYGNAWSKAWNKPVLGTYSIATTDSGTTVFNYEYTGQAITDTISVNVHINYLDEETLDYVKQVVSVQVKPTEDMIDVGAYPIGDAIGLTGSTAGEGSTNIANRVKVLKGGVSSSQILLVISPKEIPYTNTVTKQYDGSTGYMDTVTGLDGTSLNLKLTYEYDGSNDDLDSSTGAQKAVSYEVTRLAFVDGEGFLLSLIPDAVEENYHTDLSVDTAAHTIYYGGNHTTYTYDGTKVFDKFGYEVGTVTFTGDTLDNDSIVSVDIVKVYEFRKIAYAGGNANDYLDTGDMIPNTVGLDEVTEFYYAYLQVATVEALPVGEAAIAIAGYDTVAILSLTMIKNEALAAQISFGYLVASAKLQGEKAYNYAVYGTTVVLNGDGTYTVNGRTDEMVDANIDGTNYQIFTIVGQYYAYDATVKWVHKATKSADDTYTIGAVCGHMYEDGDAEYLNVYANFLNNIADAVWTADTEADLKAMFAAGGFYEGKVFEVEASITARDLSVQYENLIQELVNNGDGTYSRVDNTTVSGAIIEIVCADGNIEIPNFDLDNYDTLNDDAKAQIATVLAALGLDQHGISIEEQIAALQRFIGIVSALSVNITGADYTADAAYKEVQLTAALEIAGGSTGLNNFAIYRDHAEGDTGRPGQIKDTDKPVMILTIFSSTDEAGNKVIIGTDQALVINTAEQFVEFANIDGSNSLDGFNFALGADIDLTGGETYGSLWGAATGTVFDGQGYEILGLTIVADNLIAGGTGATVKDLILRSVTVLGMADAIKLFGDAAIDNVIVQGAFYPMTSMTDDGVLYEGIVGEYDATTFEYVEYYVGGASSAADPSLEAQQAIADMLMAKGFNVSLGDGLTADKAIVITNANQFKAALQLPTLHFTLGADINLNNANDDWNALGQLYTKDATERTVKISNPNSYTVKVKGVENATTLAKLVG